VPDPAEVVAAVRAWSVDLDGERARLEAGDHPVPAPSPTRDHASRGDRGGAPLWQVIDFAEHLGDGERAGLEAAIAT
jgi:hypothetical protein